MTDTFTAQQCLMAVMEDVTSVGKTGHNSQGNYKFRGIDAVIDAVGPAFRKHGILPLPRVTYLNRETVEVGQKRTLMALATVQVTYRFMGPAGDYVEAEDVPGEAMDSGDKAVSKAMSVAYRTALTQTLAIPTGDPDPDESSYERSVARPATPAPLPSAERTVPPGWESLEQWDDQALTYHAAFEALGQTERTNFRTAKESKGIGWPPSPDEMVVLLGMLDEFRIKSEAEALASEEPF